MPSARHTAEDGGGPLSPRHRKPIVAAALTFAVVLVLTLVVAVILDSVRSDQEHADARREGQRISGQLETEIGGKLLVARGLAALVVANRGIVDRQRFNRYANEIRNVEPGVTLALAPNGRISFSNPSRSALTGTDLLSDLPNYPGTARLVRSGRLFTAGPRGTADRPIVIGVDTVYLPGADNPRRQWGLAVAAFNVKTVVSSALLRAAPRYDAALSRPAGAPVRLGKGLATFGDPVSGRFAGSSAAQRPDAERVRVTLPGRTLELAIRPSGGYQTGETRLVTFAVGLVLALAAAALIYVLAERPRRLEMAVDTATRKLQARTAEVEELNASLEQRVAARTHQLTEANHSLEQANAELNAFSYSVSHDLRAPLRSISGFSGALEDDYADKLDAEGKEFLARIKAASARMAELIDDLLRLSRVSRQEMRVDTVDLAAVAREVAEGMNTGGRDVRWEIADTLNAEGDPRLLQAVLENLLGNALKYSAYTEHAVIELFGRRVDGVVQYVVRDNGAGFDMKHAGRLFEPFIRLHDDGRFTGTGIGLATVRRIIERHGGTISADAREGEGATFTFTLWERRVA